MNPRPPARFPAEWSGLDVALAHDWLTGMRGGERVLEVLAEAFPGAPILTLIHKAAAVSPALNRHPIRTSWLQRVPGVAATYRWFLPAFPLAAAGLRCPPARLLISTSHCVAKGFRPPPGARHLCYCFTPMRYAWLFFEEYFGRGTARRLALKPLLAALRAWDLRANARVDRFVAISRHVRDRIARFYGREADVVYPPVDTARWTPGPQRPGDYDLIVSALVPYKRVDLAVRTYTKAGRRLRVVGTGGEAARLRTLAGPCVEFLGHQPDAAVLDLYRGCRALVFPGEEDFGVVPLEAQACGRPVIAFGRGGALETVADGTSGVFFARQDESDLLEALERSHAVDWDAGAIRAHAEQFGEARFVAGLAASISRCLEGSAADADGVVTAGKAGEVRR